jgi:hypothetical protein
MSPIFSSRSRRSGLLISLLLACTLAGGCASSSGGETGEQAKIREAVRHGRFDEGVRLADELRRANPDDPQAAEIHRLASMAYLLDQGRQATFRNDDEEAMDWFLEAELIAPNTPLVHEWLEKTRHKLETHWLDIGHEAYANDKLGTALNAYLEANRYVPRSEAALKGIGEVTLLLNHRNGLGEEYYTDGVRSLSEYWLERARRSFAVTNKYQPDNLRAQRRTEEVDQQLATERIAVAQALEDEGLYAGAHNEFRFASILAPDNDEARAGMERNSVEVQAGTMLRDAQMKLYRKEFSDALSLLEQGEALTQLQHDAFATAREELVLARLSEVYQEALDLEHDQLYVEAVAAYGRILEEVEFFKDTRARQSTLQGYIEMAAAYYQQAREATDPEKRMECLRAIQGFWPDYMDVRDQLAALEG